MLSQWNSCILQSPITPILWSNLRGFCSLFPPPNFFVLIFIIIQWNLFPFLFQTCFKSAQWTHWPIDKDNNRACTTWPDSPLFWFGTNFLNKCYRHPFQIRRLLSFEWVRRFKMQSAKSKQWIFIHIHEHSNTMNTQIENIIFVYIKKVQKQRIVNETNIKIISKYGKEINAEKNTKVQKRKKNTLRKTIN